MRVWVSLLFLFVWLGGQAWAQSSSPQLVPVQSERRLEVRQFTLEGNSLIDSQALQAELAPFLGSALTLDEIKSVASRLTQYHQARGYKLVKVYVPEQNFEGGNVRLQVFEGRIGELRVAGARHRSQDMVRSYFSELAKDGNYVDSEITRQVLLLNDLPDVEAKARLQPGTEKGTADLVIDVKDRAPVGLWLNYNNYGNPASGENRAGLTVAATDLTGVGDQLSVSTILGFPTRSNVYITAGYDRPLNTSGLALGISYANSAFALGDQFEILDVRADADIFTLSLRQALARNLAHRSDISFDVSYNAIRNDLLGIRFSQDEYWKARVGYRGTWLQPGAQTLFGAGLTHGFAQSNRQLASRPGAGGSFTRLNLDLVRVQSITPKFRWNGRAHAQFTTDPVVTAEQYTVGGPYTVRGYPQGEVLGDSAYVLSSEFRWTPFKEDPGKLEFLSFIDHGQASLRQPQAGEQGSQSLTGAGVGVRFRLGEETHGRLDLGFPISPSNNSQRHSPVIYGGLQTRLW